MRKRRRGHWQGMQCWAALGDSPLFSARSLSPNNCSFHAHLMFPQLGGRVGACSLVVMQPWNNLREKSSHFFVFSNFELYFFFVLFQIRRTKVFMQPTTHWCNYLQRTTKTHHAFLLFFSLSFSFHFSFSFVCGCSTSSFVPPWIQRRIFSISAHRLCPCCQDHNLNMSARTLSTHQRRLSKLASTKKKGKRRLCHLHCK